MIDEGVRRGPAGFADSVTYAWSDAARGMHGLARLGLSSDGGSALAVLFEGSSAVGALAHGAIDAPDDADWADVELGGLRTAILAPLERWAVSGRADSASFELAFEAISAPVETDPAIAAAGGMEGYEQLCHVRGRVRTSDTEAEIDGLGQRSRAWGTARWDDLEAVRTVSVWLGADTGGLTLTSLRPAGARGHDQEALWAALVGPEGDPQPIAEPRLSTTYDGDGHQRRAGLELWLTGDDPYPRRVGGEILCGSSLDLGSLRLDCAFMRWHFEGAEGVGRYDILRRA